MRQIVFDTETTGLSPEDGHRIVEIGCVELVNLLPTGAVFHCYLNPDRDVPEASVRVHGLTAAFLADKPRFSDPAVCDALAAFFGDSELIAHNAEFDRKFLNAELECLGRDPYPAARFIDTIQLARKRFPGASNSLDALCRRFGIDLSGRDKHGALLDARLLADVYLELLGGREQALTFDEGATKAAEDVLYTQATERPGPRPILLSAEERTAHEAFVQSLGDKALWRKIRPA